MSENNKNHMTNRKLNYYSENKRQVQKILDATCIRITMKEKKNVDKQGRYTAQLNPSASTQCASFVCLISLRIAQSAQKAELHTALRLLVQHIHSYSTRCY